MENNNYSEGKQAGNRKDLYVSAGAEIKERRKALGITQEEMAERIGKSSVHVRFLETGARQSMLHVYVDIAEALHCTVNDLLTGCYSRNASLLSKELGILANATDGELEIICEMSQLLLRAMRGSN